MPTKTVIDWLTDPNTCFLFGAGCSKCAGMPLISELTEKVKTSISKAASDILVDLQGSYSRPATVEDLINHLLQMKKLLSSRKSKPQGEWTPERIETEIERIQEAIVEAIGTEWRDCETHKGFLQRLAGQRSRRDCDIFSLNYDTLIEASLEEIRLAYTDGFRGSENAYFDPCLYEQTVNDGPLFRVYKLHGSINWVRDIDETVRRRPAGAIEDRLRAVIFPAEQKYVQSQFGIYEILLSRFRNRLRDGRANNKLLVVGYSFSDEHINVVIEDSILATGSNLTVYAFVGAEEGKDQQMKRFSEIAQRCDNRFNVFVGRERPIGSALTSEEWEKVKLLDLWKFENLAGLMAGGQP